MDPELKAMHTVQKSLDGLDEATRARVLDWIWKKFGMQVAVGTLEELAESVRLPDPLAMPVLPAMRGK